MWRREVGAKISVVLYGARWSAVIEQRSLIKKDFSIQLPLGPVSPRKHERENPETDTD